MSLSERAMLITLSVSCWTGSRKDDSVVEEINAKHNARDSGRFSKYLIDKEELKPCSAHAAALRQQHYKLTLPWLDNGARLLPSRLFSEYDREIRKMSAQYDALVDTFLQRYDTLLKPDARLRLGSLYNAEDYPEAFDLRSKFGVTTDIAPVPSGSDFRVDVGDAERSRIQNEIFSRVAERERTAMGDAWKRVRDVVGNIRARLSADKPILRESLMENASELTRLLPGLNVSNDAAMSRVCQLITDELLTDITRLRSSKRERARVAEIANRILQQVPV
jgi:hypothetical protein